MNLGTLACVDAPGALAAKSVASNGLSLPRGQRALAMQQIAGQVAPWPGIDRFPITVGSRITLSYLDAAMKNALTGYRWQLVDILDELLDLEPHGFSVLAKRVIAVAGARIEITPAVVAKEEEQLAADICKMVELQIGAIPYFEEHLSSILWAIYYGIGGSELLWKRSRQEWQVANLAFLHSRRLAYPDYSRWDLHIWDQGMVRSPYGSSPTQGLFGLRVDDYPNKFLIFSPKLRGNYPTREGLGRILASYWCLKRLVLRLDAQLFERFFKPWVIATFTTGDSSTDYKPRNADDEDIAMAEAAAKGLGAGSLAAVAIPDCVKIDLTQAARSDSMSADKFLRYIDDAATKAAIGTTFTTEPGHSGARAAAVQGKDESREISRFDAACLANAIRQDLVGGIVRVNFGDRLGDDFDRFLPTVKIHLDKPDPKSVLELAILGAANNIPVDGRKVGQEIGLPLVPSACGTDDDGNAADLEEIRMKPLKAADPTGTIAERSAKEDRAAEAAQQGPVPSADDPSDDATPNENANDVGESASDEAI